MKLIFAAIFLFQISHQTNPGLYIQLNQNALDYMKSIGIQILNKQITGLKIPDVDGWKAPTNSKFAPLLLRKTHPQINYFIQKDLPEPKDLFHWWLSDISVTSFNAVQNAASIVVSAPGGLIFNIGSVSGSIHGNYKIKVGTGWLSVTKSGTVDVTLSASAHINAQLSAANGHPQVTAAGCSSSVSNLDITFHGDLIDDILDLFKGAIEDFVKDKINGIICQQLNSLTASELNPLLAKIPTSISLADGFQLDYSLTGNPQVPVSGGTIMVPFLGRVWYTGHHDDPQIPQPQPMSPVSGVNEMICFKLDAEAVVGSLGYAGQVSGMLHVDVDQSLLSSVGLDNLLKCDCGGGTCIGTFIPAIKSKCGAGGSVGMQLKSTKALTCMANSTGLFLSLFGEADIYTQAANSSSTETVLALGVTASAVLPASTLSFDGWTIKGEIHATGATISVISSQIGPVPQSSLDTLWKLALIILLEEEVNKVTKAGIKLPQIPDIDVLQPVLTFGDHSMQMCANVQYTGPM